MQCCSVVSCSDAHAVMRLWHSWPAYLVQVVLRTSPWIHQASALSSLVTSSRARWMTHRSPRTSGLCLGTQRFTVDLSSPSAPREHVPTPARQQSARVTRRAAQRRPSVSRPPSVCRLFPAEYHNKIVLLRPSWIWPSSENAGIFGRDMEAKSFLNGKKKSYPSIIKLPSLRENGHGSAIFYLTTLIVVT